MHVWKAIFFIKIDFKLSYFCKKNAKFSSAEGSVPKPLKKLPSHCEFLTTHVGLFLQKKLRYFTSGTVPVCYMVTPVCRRALLIKKKWKKIQWEDYRTKRDIKMLSRTPNVMFKVKQLVIKNDLLLLHIITLVLVHFNSFGVIRSQSLKVSKTNQNNQVTSIKSYKTQHFLWVSNYFFLYHVKALSDL